MLPPSPSQKWLLFIKWGLGKKVADGGHLFSLLSFVQTPSAATQQGNKREK
jgi:hypothetical protein